MTSNNHAITPPQSIVHFSTQGGKFVIPKAGCHVIGRRATGPTSELIVMIYCSKVYDHYIFLNRTRAADVTTEPLF